MPFFSLKTNGFGYDYFRPKNHDLLSTFLLPNVHKFDLKSSDRHYILRCIFIA